MDVYLSSTSRDLAEERLAVRRMLMRIGHRPRGMEDYGTDTRTPREVCIEDVRGCDMLVLLLGWRYGFVPADGDGKSITELEYEAAREKGIPCRVYLSPEYEDFENEPKDADPVDVQRFRDHVKTAHLVEMAFHSPDDLAGKIAADLPKGDGPISPHLPQLCDRTSQRRLIRAALRAPDAAAERRPTLFVLHGDEQQALDPFLLFLVERQLPTLLEGRGSMSMAGALDVPWPRDCSPDRFAATFAQNVADLAEVDAPDDAAALARSLAGLREPLVVYTSLPTSSWSRADGARLAAFTEMWTSWPAARSPQPMIVILTVKYYQSVKSGLFGLRARGDRKRNERIREALRALSDRHPEDDAPVRVLPELGDVPRDDADRWARQPDVREICGGRDILADVRGLYEDGKRKRLPMEKLARGLMDILRGGKGGRKQTA